MPGIHLAPLSPLSRLLRHPAPTPQAPSPPAAPCASTPLHSGRGLRLPLTLSPPPPGIGVPAVADMAMGEDEPAERRAAEAEGERPPKVARMAPPAVLDIVSTLSVCTSDSGITDDGALAQSEVHVTRREPARSERGAPPGGSCTALVVSLTANLNAGASSPSQSALDTASGCGSAPASPVVRLDAPAATDNAHLPPAVPACDQPPSNGSDADQGAACNTGGDSSDAGATPAMDDAGSGAGRSVNSIPQRERATVGGSGAGRSAESVPCLPMALQEYEVFTFFETTVGVAESELPRARKVSAA